jgi:hypothetical protein
VHEAVGACVSSFWLLLKKQQLRVRIGKGGRRAFGFRKEEKKIHPGMSGPEKTADIAKQHKGYI